MIKTGKVIFSFIRKLNELNGSKEKKMLDKKILEKAFSSVASFFKSLYSKNFTKHKHARAFLMATKNFFLYRNLKIIARPYFIVNKAD